MNNTTDWISNLENLFDIYNETPHSGVGNMTPIEAAKYFVLTREFQDIKLNKYRPILEIGNAFS